jgi:hypothetical protein
MAIEFYGSDTDIEMRMRSIRRRLDTGSIALAQRHPT